MNRSLLRLILVSMLLAPLALLSGCGIKGDLDTPPPLWGESRTETADTSASDDEDVEVEDDLDEDEIGYGIEVVD